MQSLRSGDRDQVISEKQEMVRRPEQARQGVEKGMVERQRERDGAESRLEFGRGVRHYAENDGDSTDSSEDMIILQRGSGGDEKYWSQLGKKV